jgi:hypothetical protein
LFPPDPSGRLEGNKVLLDTIKSRDPEAIDKDIRIEAEADKTFLPAKKQPARMSRSRHQTREGHGRDGWKGGLAPGPQPEDIHRILAATEEVEPEMAAGR